MPVEPIPAGPLLVVSADLGDAALSCSALLDRVDPVTILDVFTLVPEPDRVTEWDRACGFNGAKEAMAARELEEATAFSSSFHDVLAVDLLAGRYLKGARADSDELRLHSALDGWVRRAGTCTVALPAGAGLAPGAAPSVGARVRSALGGRPILEAEPDHLWVRDIAGRILRSYREATVWLYEEVPHLRSCPADRGVELFARWTHCEAERHSVSIDRGRKAERLAHYPSLVAGRFRTRRVARRLPSSERYWVLKPTA